MSPERTGGGPSFRYDRPTSELARPGLPDAPGSRPGDRAAAARSSTDGAHPGVPRIASPTRSDGSSRDALDILASGQPAEARLAGLLDLLARIAGAQRAAVVADGVRRRVAVAASGPDDTPAALDLASLARYRRPAHPRRACRGRTRRGRRGHPDAGDASATGAHRPSPYRAWSPVPSAGAVTLGFGFGRARDAEAFGDRLPPALARHAAVALALVTEQLATERELADARARDDRSARRSSRRSPTSCGRR